MKSYGYGYHCCIMRDRGSHDLKDVLQKAISEGYSFVEFGVSKNVAGIF